MGKLPAGWDLVRVKEVGRLRDDPFLVDAEIEVRAALPGGLVEELTADVIIDCGGNFVVRPQDGDDWLIGALDNDGAIRCFASYGPDLEAALRAL